MIIVSWSLVFTIGGCGQRVTGGTTPSDLPTITLVYPANGASNVAITAGITATFSKDMDPATINTSTFTLAPTVAAFSLDADVNATMVTANISYDASTRTALFRPVSPLTLAMTYTATVAATVKDIYGIALGTPHSWSFTTSATADSTPPTFAGLVSLEVNSSSKVTLFWGPASDDITPQNRIIYQIFQGNSAAAVLSMTTPSYTTMDATTYQVHGLTQTTTYYFLVRAMDESGNKDSNAVTMNGTLLTLSVPQQTRPLSCYVMPAGSNLGWASTTYADGYQVQLSTNRTFSSISETSNPSTNSYTPTSTGILFWRVRAKEEGNYSAWSQIWELTLGKTAGDINGDGYADVIIGAPGADCGGTNKGQAYVYLGGPSFTGNLATSDARAIISGAINDDGLGGSVSMLGDVDGDGYADMLIGAAGAAGDKGEAYLFYGDPSLSGTALTTLDANVTITGANASDYLGERVESVGDVNGDGYSDFAVSIRAASDKGRICIFFGGPSLSRYLTPSNANITITGAKDGDYLGSSIGWADVNGDGYSDVMVGAQGADEYVAKGKAYVFYGSSTLSGAKTPANADLTLTGENDGDNFGLTGSGAGDVNGDGFGDLLFGAPSFNSLGRAYVFFGGASLPSSRLASAADAKVTGTSVNGQLSSQLSGAGDLNKDGFADLLISDYAASTNHGKTYVFYGSSSFSGSKLDLNADLTLAGENNNDYFGFSVAGAGDVNGDTYADTLAGAYGYISDDGKGRAYVFWGGSPMNGTSDVTLTGSKTGDYFSRSVGGAKQ